MRNRSLASIFLLALPLCHLPAARAQTHKPPTESQLATSSPVKGPYSLQGVLELLDYYKKHVANEQDLIEKLARGVDFVADTETLATLREQGATEPIIAEIQKRAKKKPEPKGTVALRCVPAECRISVNGQPARSTTEGRFEMIDLKPGEPFSIDVTKDGYLPEHPVLRAAVAPVKETIVTLVPNDANKLHTGKMLFDTVVQGLGGDLKRLEGISGAGSATTYKNGKPVTWDFDLATAAPQMIEMRVTSSLGDLIYVCDHHRCEEKKKGFLFIKRGKKLPAGVAADLETSLAQFSNYNLVSVMGALAAESVNLRALPAELRAKTERNVTADGRDFTYILTIGPDSLLTSVEYKPRSGLGAARITYGNYAKLGNCTYPKNTVIALQGSSEAGIEVKLDHVELGSKLRPRDLSKD